MHMWSVSRPRRSGAGRAGGRTKQSRFVADPTIFHDALARRLRGLRRQTHLSHKEKNEEAALAIAVPVAAAAVFLRRAHADGKVYRSAVEHTFGTALWDFPIGDAKLRNTAPRAHLPTECHGALAALARSGDPFVRRTALPALRIAEYWILWAVIHWCAWLECAPSCPFPRYRKVAAAQAILDCAMFWDVETLLRLRPDEVPDIRDALLAINASFPASGLLILERSCSWCGTMPHVE